MMVFEATAFSDSIVYLTMHECTPHLLLSPAVCVHGDAQRSAVLGPSVYFHRPGLRWRAC